LAGKTIADNITNAVHNSRKTVTILTTSFLKSHWCMYEFNMARMESIYQRSGENVLFMVMLEKIPHRKLPLHLMDLIDSQSYLEYTENNDGNIVFWNKLKMAINT